MPSIRPASSLAHLYLAAAIALSGTAPRAAAQSFIEHVEPPVAERGKTTRVTLVGSRLANAVGLWTSLPAGKIKATPVASRADRATFDLTVAADAPVGLFGLRAATSDGLGNAHLFLIDDLPVRPRPSAADPGPVPTPLPTAVWGTFREGGVDRFAIDVKAGQRVSFEVVGNRFGHDADPLVTIRDARGKWVAERDNDPGLYFDCRFSHTFAAAGTYTVEVKDARNHGSEHWPYVLRMGRFPAARVAVPAAVRPGRRAVLSLPERDGQTVTVNVPADQPEGPFFAALRRPGDDGSAWVPVLATTAAVTTAREANLAWAKAIPAEVPGVLCGILAEPGDRIYFRFHLERGQAVHVRGLARALNSPAELELALIDSTGREVQRAGEIGREELTLAYTAPSAGAYGVMVREATGEAGPALTYRIEVQTGGPYLHLQAEAEGLTVPQGSYQTVPLTLTRTDFVGPVKLALIGAPSGMKIAPDEIAAGVNAQVVALSAAGTVPTGLYTIRIVARPAPLPTDGPSLPVVSVFRTQPLIDRQLVNVDLIPYALREDQRRLPPSLTDRLAVQVTPPAPFTLELPEPLVTLPRYQSAHFPLVTTRIPGFDGPIAFAAKGGQLADKNEGRTRVYAEFPPATPAALKVTGGVYSRILLNLARHRVDVTGTATYRGRQVSLTRSFELDIRPAFAVTAEPAKLTLPAGGVTRVRLRVERLPTFDGPVTVRLSRPQGLDLPESATIAKGQSAVEFEVRADAMATPGRRQVQLNTSGTVGSYEEEVRAPPLEVEVPKPPPPPKKGRGIGSSGATGRFSKRWSCGPGEVAG